MAAEPGEGTQLPAISLLLVEDDPDVSWALGRQLLREGFDVVAVGDGAEALSLLATRDFDILVVDLNLPKVSGMQVIAWAHEHAPVSCVIVITGCGSPAIKRLSLETGATVYLEKPVSASLLVDIIRLGVSRAGSFTGAMIEISLLDFVQMLVYTRRSAVVDVTAEDGDTCEVYVENGRLVHAESPSRRGEEALMACLTLERGAFVTLPWREPPERTIRKSGEEILLEVATAADSRGA